MSAGRDKNPRLAWTMVAIVGGMLGLAYAAVPLYQAFCKATGFAGTPLVARESADRPVIGRTVEVRYDGVGFDPQSAEVRSRHLGLTSMEERARELGGRLEIRSAPGSGTTVLLLVEGDG